MSRGKGTQSFWTAVAYVAGSCIGSGIFCSPGNVMVNVGSGGAALLVWLSAGLVAAAGGLCYAEVGLWYPDKEGGEVMFLRELWGNIAAFCYAWVCVFVCKPAILAIVVSIFGSNFNAAVGLPDDVPFFSKLPALLGILTLAAVNAYSATAAASMQRIITSVKVCSLVGLTLAVIPFLFLSPDGYAIPDTLLDAGNTTGAEADPPQQGGLPPVYPANMGFNGTSTSLGDWGEAFLNALWAYDGWNLIAYFVVDMKQQERCREAVLVGVGLVAILYVSVTSAYSLMLPKEAAGSSTILVEYLGAMFGASNRGIGKALAGVVVTISTFGSGNGSMYCAPRVVMESAHSGYIPALFGVKSQRGTPQRAIICQSIVASLLILFVDYASLLLYFGSATYAFYSMVAAGVMYKRLRGDHPPVATRVPLAVPALFIMFSAILVVSPLVKRTVPTVLSYAAAVSGIPMFFLIPSIRGVAGRLGCCIYLPVGHREGSPREGVDGAFHTIGDSLAGDGADGFSGLVQTPSHFEDENLDSPLDDMASSCGEDTQC